MYAWNWKSDFQSGGRTAAHTHYLHLKIDLETVSNFAPFWWPQGQEQDSWTPQRWMGPAYILLMAEKHHSSERKKKCRKLSSTLFLSIPWFLLFNVHHKIILEYVRHVLQDPALQTHIHDFFLHHRSQQYESPVSFTSGWQCRDWQSSHTPPCQKIDYMDNKGLYMPLFIWSNYPYSHNISNWFWTMKVQTRL